MNYKYIIFGINTIQNCEGISSLPESLKQAGFQIRIQTPETCHDSHDCHFDFPAAETLYIGSSSEEIARAAAASFDVGLAMWSCHSPRHIRADYYLSTPWDLYNLLTRTPSPWAGHAWLRQAMELQFIAQAGITYSRDPYDLERFERIRELSAELLAKHTDTPIEKVRDLFCNETGFQTPKLDTRAAIFRDGKILLVKEASGTWSLPGGWVDVNQSIKSNTVKEVKEEAGLDVIPIRLIALQDRNLHNLPVYAYGVCKAFVLCEAISGQFTPNLETTASGFFSLEELPPLAEEKNTAAQIRICFEATKNPNWQPVFD